MAYRPPRVKGFSYRGYYRYFITACTQGRLHWFADARRAHDLTAQLSPFFATYGFEVLAYCVMPDHVHLLLEGLTADANLREAMRQWKQKTARECMTRYRARLWQAGFHERVLREGDDIRAVVGYVLQNPVRAGLVRSARDWPWIGSSRYSIGDLEAHAGEWAPEWKRRIGVRRT